jgi:hypothetical protein
MGYNGIVITIGGNILTPIRKKAVEERRRVRILEYPYAAGKQVRTTSRAEPIVTVALSASEAKNPGQFSTSERYPSATGVKKSTGL